MGNGVSQDQHLTENQHSQQTKNITQNTDNCNDINFNSEIKRPEGPDISKMDEDEAFDTVCSEIDQALAGHYTFLLSNPKPKEEKKPALQQVEKLLEEQGFNDKNPDLTDATQSELVKPYLQKKKTISPQPIASLHQEIDSFWEEVANNKNNVWASTANQTKTPGIPPACKLPKKFRGKKIPTKNTQERQINEILLHNRALIAQNQSASLQPKSKGSSPKLDSITKNMPSLDPIGIEGNRWVRPESLVAEEKKAQKKYGKTASSEELSRNRMQEYGGGYQPQVGYQEFDASKFAEANAKTKKDLNIYTETTYSKYKKSTSQDRQVSQDSMKRPQVSLNELDLQYDPSMEALLAEIEDEFK